MLQYSKVIKSRDEWKDKACRRGNELREQRKTKKRHLKTIDALKLENSELQLALTDKKSLRINCR